MNWLLFLATMVQPVIIAVLAFLLGYSIAGLAILGCFFVIGLLVAGMFPVRL